MSTNRSRVLVIDDDPLFRSLITSMLRRDYFVAVASDGAEGYYKALEHPPQLAVIDVQMPGWDGLRTVQAFRAHQALARVPVMMLTSDAARQTVVAAIESGANEYVIKTTLSREELLKKARRLVNLDPSRIAAAAAANGAPPAGDTPAAEGPGGIADNDQSSADFETSPVAKNEASELQALMDNWE